MLGRQAPLMRRVLAWQPALLLQTLMTTPKPRVAQSVAHGAALQRRVS